MFLLQRETKANGQFGKLKQLGIRPYEVSRLVGAEDAEILNLLLGYHDVESHRLYYGYSSSRVTEAVLPKNMQQFLLPKLAATQRLARVEKTLIISRSSRNFGRWPGMTGRHGDSASTSSPTTCGSAGP